MSRTLHRLRRLFDDELLVRGDEGYAPDAARRANPRSNLNVPTGVWTSCLARMLSIRPWRPVISASCSPITRCRRSERLSPEPSAPNRRGRRSHSRCSTVGRSTSSRAAVSTCWHSGERRRRDIAPRSFSAIGSSVWWRPIIRWPSGGPWDWRSICAGLIWRSTSKRDSARRGSRAAQPRRVAAHSTDHPFHVTAPASAARIRPGADLPVATVVLGAR